jgi:hypothetical protein
MLEAGMKASKRTPLILLSMAIAALALLAACSPPGETAGSIAAQAPAPARDASPPDSAGMVSFQGSIFVAASGLIGREWQNAGWRIGERALDTETRDAPVDCTLYPHFGVENQWIGRCKGSILVPEAGAAHIAVMVTGPDGAATMVQVAPRPAGP